MNIKNLFTRLTHPAANPLEAAKQDMAWVESLSLEEAKTRLQTMMAADANLFEIVLGDGRVPLLAEKLAPELRRFIARYRRIAFVELGMETGYDYLKPYEGSDKVFQIGTDLDGDTALVKPADEGIYTTDGDDITLDLESPIYHSIYHWLLFNALP